LVCINDFGGFFLIFLKKGIDVFKKMDYSFFNIRNNPDIKRKEEII